MLQVPPWSLLRGNVCLHSHPAMTDAHLSLVASMSLNLLWLGPSQLSRNLSLQEPVTQPTPPSSRKHLLPWLPFSASSVDDPSPNLLPPVAPGIRPPASSLPWVHSPHGNLSHRCHRSADDPQVHVMPSPAASMSRWCLQAAQICRAHVNGAHPPQIHRLPSAPPPQHRGRDWRHPRHLSPSSILPGP